MQILLFTDNVFPCNMGFIKLHIRKYLALVRHICVCIEILGGVRV